MVDRMDFEAYAEALAIDLNDAFFFTTLFLSCVALSSIAVTSNLKWDSLCVWTDWCWEDSHDGRLE